MTSTLETTPPPTMMTRDEIASYAQDATRFPPHHQEAAGDPWKIHAQDEGIILAQKALLTELDEFRKAMAAILLHASENANPTSTTTTELTSSSPDAALEPCKISCVQSIWKYHCKQARAHYKAKKKILFPVLQERIRIPKEMIQEHDKVFGQLLDELDRQVMHRLFSLREVMALDQALKEEENGYQQALQTCCHCFETQLQPVWPRVFYTQADMMNPMAKAVGQQGGGAAGSLVYAVTGPDRFRNVLMPLYGMPFFLWYLSF